MLQPYFYLGRLQRPEVSNQGTLQEVTRFRSSAGRAPD